MADTNGDYISRFERMEKTLETIVQVQQIQASNLASLLAVQQSQGERAAKTDARIDHLTTEVNDLVQAIRSLIDRIPPQSLQ